MQLEFLLKYFKARKKFRNFIPSTEFALHLSLEF